MKSEIVNKEAINNLENSRFLLNNHGEASQKNSSHSSFNTMLEGFFPQPQPHTSPEEKDVSGSSPDYFNETNKTQQTNNHELSPREDQYRKNDSKENESVRETEDQEKNFKEKDSEKVQENDKDQNLNDNATEKSEKDEVTEKNEENSQKNESSEDRSTEKNEETKDAENTAPVKEKGSEVTDGEIKDDDLNLAIDEIKKILTDLSNILENNDNLKLDQNLKKNLQQAVKQINLLLENIQNNSNETTTLLSELNNYVKDNKDSLNNIIKAAESVLKELVSPADTDIQVLTEELNEQFAKIQEPLNQLNNIISEQQNSKQMITGEITAEEETIINEDILSALKNTKVSAVEDKNLTSDSNTDQAAETANLKNSEIKVTADSKQPQTADNNKEELPESENRDSRQNQGIKKPVADLKEDISNTNQDSDTKTEVQTPKDNITFNTEIISENSKDNTSPDTVKNTVKNISDETLTENTRTIQTDKAPDLKNIRQQNTAKENMTEYLTKAFEAEKSIMEKITAQAKLRLKGDIKEINMQLTPKDLGNVKITLTEKAGIVSGTIKVDSEAIKEIVETNINQLRRSLGENIKIDKLDVEVKDDGDFLKNSLLQHNRQNNKGNLSKETNDNTGYGTYMQDDISEENITVPIDVPKGVIENNGILSVDLIG